MITVHPGGPLPVHEHGPFPAGQANKIVKCTCGTYFVYRCINDDDGFGGSTGWTWTTISWWNWRARRYVAAWERGRDHTPGFGVAP